MNRQNTDVHQTGGKSDERGRLSKNGKNKTATPTLRDDEDEVTEEVVRPHSSRVTSRSEFGQPKTNEIQSSETPIAEVDSASSSGLLPPLSAQPLKTPIRTRYGVINQWPSFNNSSRSNKETSGSGDANLDVPLLTPPAAVDESPTQTLDVPRLLPPNG